jgi:tetratricopeptide (TPR) repeat protein
MHHATSNKWLKAMHRGQKKYGRGMFREALAQFSTATRIAPAKSEGWVNLGATQMEIGQLEEASSSLKKALGLNPELMQAHLVMGDVLRREGNWGEAINSYGRAIALQKTPEGLNKLACALRVVRKLEESEALYREALRMNPAFTLARVNLAGVQAELGRIDEANQQLRELKRLPLSAAEQEEVDSTSITISQFFHHMPAIDVAMSTSDLSALHGVLLAIPEAQLQVDVEIVEAIRAYAEAARQLPVHPDVDHVELPADWPLIEALFMIPYVESPGEYREVRKQISGPVKPEGDLQESINMEAVVIAAREARDVLHDPVKAEMHLRYWHALATRDVANMLPGQFKITGNLVVGHEHRRRVKPHLVPGTLRHFFSEIYATLPPGLPRGLVTMMAISDIHPFADGNGRLAQTLLNRELEWAHQMPVLFTREMGIAGGKFTAATSNFRLGRGSVFDVVTVIRQGQQFARDFCAELLSSRTVPKHD